MFDITVIATDPAKREDFLREAGVLQGFLKSEGWQIFISKIEEMKQNAHNNMTLLDPDKPGAFGREQGKVTALVNVINFEQALKAMVYQVQALPEPGTASEENPNE